jgi:hypothetical protein
MDMGDTNGQDGLMFEDCVRKNWRVLTIRRCLFSHSPNPYMCGRLGGVWFNSPSSRAELSDACWTHDRATEEQKRNPMIKALKKLPHVLSLPKKEHAESIVSMAKDQQAFALRLQIRMRPKRSKECKELQESGYALNAKHYLEANPDLQILKSDKDLEEHFWTDGCLELRKVDKKGTIPIVRT